LLVNEERYKTYKKIRREELIKLIDNGDVAPENNYVPFYDDNGRPLHFVKPKNTDKK